MTVPPRTPAERPAVILLHGSVVNGRMWDPIVPSITPTHRVFTPDLPGHGYRRNEPYTVASAAAAVQELVGSLAPSQVVLVGDSLGSYTAMAAAPALGDRLAGAVLAGATANFRGLTAIAMGLRGALFRIFPKDRLQRILETRVAREFEAGPAMVEDGLRPDAFGEAVASLRGIDFRPLLAGIAAPVLLVNGTRDRLARRDEASFLAAARRGSLELFPGVGHGVSIIKPAEYARVIVEFLNRLN
ncbi:MAG: alpha/beta hydrolase [Gemmatimonadales bacterium]|nr:alpha/beta hydrolase [Gemmatimonadales bacterium]